MVGARPLACAVVLAAVALTATRAHASPCDAALGRPFTGPAELGVRESGLGVPRSPCRRRELFARLLGAATIDTPDFYGTLVATTQLGVRWPLALWGGLELSADAAVADFRFAQNASVKASELTYGPFALGLLWEGSLRVLGVPVSLAPALRLVVPASRLGVDGERGAGELALHLGLRPRRWLSLDAHVGALVQLFEAADGGTSQFHQAYAALGAGIVLRDWLALLAGGEAGFGWYGAGLDHLLVRGGLRFAVGRAGTFDLAVAAPVAGSERTDLLVLLGWSQRL